MSENEKEGINLVIIGTEFQARKFFMRCQEMLQITPYLPRLLLKLDAFLLQPTKPYHHSPQTSKNSGINHKISGVYSWLQEKNFTGTKIDF